MEAKDLVLEVALHLDERCGRDRLGNWSNAIMLIQAFDERKTPRWHVLKKLLQLLTAVLSGPNGDQGGWESGARGL